MIFLSKDGQDEYINMLAAGNNAVPTSTDDFVYESSQDPIVLRGILKYKIMHRCWEDGRDFYYVDTGYFGNGRWKEWHRIVKNDIQHSKIIPRPADRFKKFNKEILPWKKDGRKILVALPDEKPCRFYSTDLDTWTYNTVEQLKKYTDRPIEIRSRAPRREDRVLSNTLQQALDDDVFALVTFNSNAATESIFHGIPAFVLAPTHAASPVSLQDITQIETPLYAENRYEWACHLAYGQFHISEMKDGSAMRMLLND